MMRFRSRPWVRVGLLSGLLASAACGESSLQVDVTLSTALRADLDPFSPELGLDVVQLAVTGDERGDEAIVSLSPGERTASVTGYPAEDDVTLSVRAEGLDAQGNLIAFGRAPTVTAGGDIAVQFPLRRNLAYVTHLPNAGQQNPERFVYVLELATRSLVEKIRIEGDAPRGDRITARGGESLLLTYRDGAQGYLGILSADDHTWRRIALPAAQTVAVGVEGKPIGVVAGDGKVTFVDLDAAEVVEEFPRVVGGTVRDGVMSGDGSAALFILDAPRGNVIFVDVERRTVEPLDVVRDPSGVALSADGRVAFVASGVDAVVAEVDLRNGRVVQSNGFARPVGRAAFSENMQAVLALDADPLARRVLALLPRANCPQDISLQCGQALPVADATPTTESPVDLAADGVGRQVLVIGAGSSTAAAGLTLIETFPGIRQLPIGARSLYPGDPDDTFVAGRNFVGRQRYQPRSVAIIYGR